MMSFLAFVCWIQLLVLAPFIDCYRWPPKSYRSLPICKADERESWTYRGRNGPKFWSKTYPTCAGKEQSPISINSHGLVRDANLEKLHMHNYQVPVTRATIRNNGHTIEVTPTDDVYRSIFVNDATYRLTQFHFHWGDAYYSGSEHIIDGTQYALEIHFVHQNADNHIAVVGVLFQEQSGGTQELQNLIKEFPNVMYKDTRTELKNKINLKHLIPYNPSSYYRYMGSLTTPACDEGVTWSVLTKPLPVGINQMAEFRKLFSATKSEAGPNCRLSNNFRPVQPLNYRTVFISQ